MLCGALQSARQPFHNWWLSLFVDMHMTYYEIKNRRLQNCVLTAWPIDGKWYLLGSIWIFMDRYLSERIAPKFSHCFYLNGEISGYFALFSFFCISWLFFKHIYNQIKTMQQVLFWGMFSSFPEPRPVGHTCLTSWDVSSTVWDLGDSCGPKSVTHSLGTLLDSICSSRKWQCNLHQQLERSFICLRL